MTKEEKKQKKAQEKAKKAQPAKISPFAGPAWHNYGKTLNTFWKLNQDDIRKRGRKLESGKGIVSASGMGNFLTCIFLILFGTLFSFIISVVVSAVLGVAFLIIYIFIFLLWLIDRIELRARGIFVACPVCKQKFLIPTYVCECGAEHTMLVPGKYGVLYRRCNCGRKLPSHFLTGRGKLPAICPNPACRAPLSETATKPLSVPVVGGRSAAKTAFITAFSYNFIERVAPNAGLTVSFYNEQSEALYKNDICSDYLNGTTRMTAAETDPNQASSKAFSFKIHSSKQNFDRLITIYDVAGESFANNTEMERQLQYTYCDGIVLMIDPLIIPDIRTLSEDDPAVTETDLQSLGTDDMNKILNGFLEKLNLRENINKEKSGVYNVPIAVVISKCDLHSLEPFIGDDVILNYMNERGLGMETYYAVEDYFCKKFLKEYMPALAANVNTHFKDIRYFKCSAIGHTRETGKYKPIGVMEPMEWIFQLADSKMKSVWHTHNFSTLQE